MSVRRLVLIPAPPGRAGLDALLTPLETALAGGPAVLPVDPAAPYDPAGLFQPDEPLEDDSVAAVVATSGSTGRPKGALLSAAALSAAAAAAEEALGGPGQWMLALPPASVAGLMQLIRSICAGTTPVPAGTGSGFTALGFVEATSRMGPGRRYTSLVPAQLARITADPAGRDALASYDAVLVGGAALDASVLAAATGARVVHTYGMTESCGGCVYDGVPLAGTEVRLGDGDRVHLRGPTLFSGYRLQPGLTAATLLDGWLRTEDRGRWSADGRLSVLGRLDDVVVSGGVNVDVAAVESALADLAALQEAAVVAVPDPEWGARIVAVVVPATDALPADQLGRTVRDRVRDRLGAPASPREVVVVAELPRLPSGKVDRQACRDLARASGQRTT